MADGEIKIKATLDAADVKKGVDEIKNSLKSLGGASSSFGQLGDFIGKIGNAFNVLSGTIGRSKAGFITSVGAMVLALNKLYDASKQNFANNIQTFGQVFQKIGSVVATVGSEIVNTFSQVTGLEFSFSSLIASGIEFESTMARVGAIMGVTGNDMDMLTAKTRQIAATSRYTSLEVADAFSYMGMAGYGLQDSLNSINDMLNLCTISGGDLGTVSDIITDSITALGMSSAQTGDFVDALAATITKSNTNVEQFGETMRFVGPVAGTLGVNIQDLSTAIGLMASSSLKGSLAGTSLRTLLSNLSSPTKATAEAMNKYGIELKTAADGSVDLDATLQNLRSSLKGLPLKEQAAAAKALAGKTGMAGLLSIVNATDDAYNSLKDSIENSSSTVSYWNENLARAGIKGQECSSRIEMLKNVLADTEYIGAAFNATTQDMALALQVLSTDAKVTSADVENLFNVFSVMRNPTKSQANTMKQLGLTYREVGDTAFDYSKTCQAIDTSITGLTQKQKEQIKGQLKANMTLKEANDILAQYSEYQLKAQTKSTGQIDLIANLQELRKAYGGMSEEARKASLEQLGLGDALSVVDEICAMSDKDFKMYCENLKLATGLSEKMAKAMDETTKNGLLKVSSAIQDVGIEAFERLKPAIQGASDSLTKFFTVWRSGNIEGNVGQGQKIYTFENFKKALNGLKKDIENANLAGAIGNAINKAVGFIKGGGLGSILEIGGTIIHQICQGIIQNKDKIKEGISSAIGQIASFVKEHASEIGQAGVVILEALRDGIENNKEEIYSALEAVAGAMDSWIQDSAEIESMTGHFAKIFADSLVNNMSSAIQGKAGELWNVIGDILTPSKTPDMKKGGTGLLSGLLQWLFPDEASAGEKTGNETPLGGKKKSTSKLSDTLGKMNSAELENFNKQLSALQQTAQTVAQSVGQSFVGIQDSIRNSMVGCADIVRNQFTNISDIVRNQATNSADAVRNQFTNMSNIINNQMTNCANVVRDQFTNVSNIVRNQSLNSANIVRNQFVNMANIVRNQMVNCANIVRNQFVNMSNIVRNQSLNSANIVRNQFVNMANIVRNQMVNCANIVRNQMTSISNVIRNQARNARNAFTTQFMSLGKVARTQISQARNVVTSQMISMANVIRTQANSARNSFTSAMISIKNVARTQSAEAGRAIASGLASGIRSGTASAVAAARSMVSQVNAVVKSAAKIASPSKITTQYGIWYAQGFGVGIKQSMPSVYRVALSGVEELNEKVKSTVSAEVSKISINAKASSSSKIVSMANNKASIDGKDINKLTDSINNMKVAVAVQLDKRTLVNAIAEPIQSTNAKNAKRLKRLEG